jgi:hypothetical protein
MIRLELQQRAALSGTIRELANLVAAAFVLGQFVGERPFSRVLGSIGAVAWIALVVFGLLLERRRR